MKGRTKFLIFLSRIILLALGSFPLFGGKWPLVGACISSWTAVLDYKFATKPPTKFFPAVGEKKRSVERG